ncbi:MAG TPA: cobyric acid synthase [Gaiellaceae bacterium]
MRALMVQGASSSAGKSLLTTALARLLHRRGIDVAPFKAQNMSNNARVVAGGEIGTAQYLQALAAGLEPEVRMNPILVKPEGDNQSQVVVLGKPDLELSRLPWRERPAALWPVIERSLQRLRAEHELLLLEGAGSPAEINLQDTDLANMRTAQAADARVLLVCDIDRGGAFAHLYGTWALLPAHDRERIAGFVLNKFRGDPALLPPAPEQLEQHTGVRTLGVLPWLEHGLPDEDGAATPNPQLGRGSVAVVRYPTAPNLDEFKQLEQVADLHWLDSPQGVNGTQLLILPGSKHVAADLAWLKQTGLADAVCAHAASGRPVLGICGGMQMLGERVDDEAGVDGSGQGLGLLPLATAFARSKQTTKTTSRFQTLAEPWAQLTGKTISGYQIHHGRTETTGSFAEALPEQLGFVSGPVLGIYLHGLFEQPELLVALFGAAPRRSLEQAFDELADAVEAHIDIDAILTEIGTP